MAVHLAFGCIVYSHVTETTPECLTTGIYRQSMVLMPDSDYDSYALNVLKDIKRREKCYARWSFYKEPLNKQTHHVANELLNHELSMDSIARAHIDVYARFWTVSNSPVTNLEDKARTSLGA